MGGLGFSRSFAQAYLKRNLSKIIGSGYESFQCKIAVRYPSSENWFVDVRVSQYPVPTLKIVGMAKFKHQTEKNYRISQFLRGNKEISTYRPLYWDKRRGLFFYEYISGISYREMVESDSAGFSEVKKKLPLIFEILNNLRKKRNVPRFVKKEKIRIAETKHPGLVKFAGMLKKYFSENSIGSSNLVHGDFQAGNIILEKNRPVMIDWDAAMLGDPLYDVGTFFAHTNLMFDYHYDKQAKLFLKGSIWRRFQGKKQRMQIGFFSLLTYLKIAKYIQDMSQDVSKEDDVINKIVQEANLVARNIKT